MINSNFKTEGISSTCTSMIHAKMYGSSFKGLTVSDTMMKFKPEGEVVSNCIKNNLHWLPITQRAEFKLWTLAFAAIIDITPAYDNAMIPPSSRVTKRT